MSKTIMILGAGTFQLPAIEQANSMGYRTIAVSYYPNDPGMNKAHKGLVYSTLDKERLVQIAQEENIDGIMTMASEVAAVSVAYIAEKLKLPGYDFWAAQTIADKYKLRGFLKKVEIDTPGFGIASTLEESMEIFEKLKKPLIIKPTCASGSRGVYKLFTKNDLETYFKKSISSNLLNKEVIIEEFMEGTEVGGEAIISNGKIIFLAITKKYVNRFFVPYGHLLPCDIDKQYSLQIRRCLQTVVNKLKLKNGPLNFDIMLTSDGPMIIELGGRLGGNCLPELMRAHTGTNTVQATIEIALGNTIEGVINYEENPVAAYILGSDVAGKIVQKKLFRDVFPKYKDLLVKHVSNCKVGDVVNAFVQGNHQLGYYMIKHSSPDSLIEIMDEIHKIKWFEVI